MQLSVIVIATARGIQSRTLVLSCYCWQIWGLKNPWRLWWRAVVLSTVIRQNSTSVKTFAAVKLIQPWKFSSGRRTDQTTKAFVEGGEKPAAFWFYFENHPLFFIQMRPLPGSIDLFESKSESVRTAKPVDCTILFKLVGQRIVSVRYHRSLLFKIW